MADQRGHFVPSALGCPIAVPKLREQDVHLTDEAPQILLARFMQLWRYAVQPAGELVRIQSTFDERLELFAHLSRNTVRGPHVDGGSGCTGKQMRDVGPNVLHVVRPPGNLGEQSRCRFPCPPSFRILPINEAASPSKPGEKCTFVSPALREGLKLLPKLVSEAHRVFPQAI